MRLPFTLHSFASKLFLVSFVGVLCIGLFVFAQVRQLHAASDTPNARISLALPTQISAGAFFVAKNQGFFAGQNLAVSTTTFPLGRDALQAVLLGKADLAVLADTPFMFAVMKGEKIATVATVFGSRKAMMVLGRKDRHILRAEDLSGKTVASLPGTNTQYFLDTLLLVHGVPPDSVKIVNLAPEAMASAMHDGSVDAITAWNPKLVDAVGEGVTAIYGKELFVYRFIVVGKQDYLDRHGTEIRRLLTAIDQANQFIREEPERAKILIATAINIEPRVLARVFEPNDFQTSLDQSLLLSLSDQTRWAMRQRLVPVGPVPNYLDFVRQAPLDAVRPSANKIIR